MGYRFRLKEINVTWANNLNRFPKWLEQVLFKQNKKKNGGNNLGLTSSYKGGYHKRDG